MSGELNRCAWVTDDPLYITYHDTEWGVPVRDDRKLFEFLTLETFQAGLSWLTVLRKRAHFRQAFDGFDFEKIARYRAARIESLLRDSGIIRNRKKIEATVANARAFLAVREAFGSFARYIWDFTDGRVICNHWRTQADVPAATPLSVRIARDMKARGFQFIGPTVLYAHMQATGMVNDHTTDCFRHHQLKCTGDY